MNFVPLQYKDRVINLNTLSNINVDYQNLRIVYNFDFSIETITRDGPKTIQCYTYLDFDSENELREVLDRTLNTAKEHGIVLLNANGNIIFNLDKVSSWHFNDEKLSIVFDMNCGVQKGDKIVSDFKYVNFDSEESYYEYIDTLKQILKL
jgi:hypothetical protein